MKITQQNRSRLKSQVYAPSMVARRGEKTFHWHINRLQSEAQKGNYAVSLKKNI